MKLVLSAVALVLVGLGLFLFLRGDEPRGARSAEPRPSAPATAEPAPAALPVADRPETSDESRAVVESTPEPEAPAPAALQKDRLPPARVTGRCVDAFGRPLAGVELSERGEVLTHGAADGSFDFEIQMALARRTLDLRFALVGSGTLRQVAELRAGETTELHDVVLQESLPVGGRVIDRGGVALEGILVHAAAADGREVSRFEAPYAALAQTKTDARGHFRFEDLAAGSFLRVHAGGEGWRWSTSEPLELVPGGDLLNLELVLEPLAPEDVIEVHVVSPGGDPVPRAPIQHRYETRSRSSSGSTQTDERGIFRLFVDVPAPRSFLAADPEGRFCAALALDVEPGTGPVELRLRERQVFRLEVEDQHGAPVEAFQNVVRLKAVDFTIVDRSKKPQLAPGVVEVLDPPATFDLEVSAEGYERVTLGPFEPGLTTVKATLTSLPGIHGIVRANGEPVAGATVEVHPEVGPTSREVVNGFPCYVQRRTAATAKSDAEGRFTLTVREAQSFYVRAQAVGFAPTELGPLRLDPSVGMDGLELELGHGGTIEGRVLVRAGEDPAGRIVGASRGDGFGVTTRTDAEGRFRFTQCTPGPWQVLGRKDEIRSNSVTSTSSSADTPYEIPWSCRVREGQTTYFDVDLRDQVHAVLKGRLRLGGQPAEGWTASLADDDSTGPSASTTLDAAGSFTLERDALGPCTLELSRILERGYVNLSIEITLAEGDNAFDRDIPAARVSGRVPPGFLSSSGYLNLYAEGDDYTMYAGPEPDASGAFVAPFCPVGTVSANWLDAKGDSGSKELTIPKEGLAELVLP